MSIELPTQLQQYIHLSRYARWLEDEKRRETWEETVDRYASFFKGRFPDSFPQQRIADAIKHLDVMPSMRALMTAGPALDKDEVAGFNCSFVAVDHVRSFDEILYILMCGTGVGFSVERQHIANLPAISETMHPCDATIVVPDSKVGWASSFRQLLSLLYNGQIPTWDVSKIRPAGAKLKTFGGRASGPRPLEDLFAFTVEMFTKAAGRKLNSVECHDLVCKIADIVVVGGVRRSALISLSNLSDDRMRVAKSGQWWVDNGQRALANNSAAYTEKPDMELFMEEWMALVKSKSGERGIFNRVAAKKKVLESGRRNPDFDFGTNPSLRAGTLVLTVDGVVPIEKLEGLKFQVPVGNGDFAPAICRMSSPSAALYELTLASGRKYYATAEHKWPVIGQGKRTTVELKAGDRLPTGTRALPPTGTERDAQDGFLIGYWLGNGWRTVRSDNGVTQFGLCLPERRADLREFLIESFKAVGVETTLPARDNGTYEMSTSSVAFERFLKAHGIEGKDQKDFIPVWNNTGKFLRGLLDGLLASDGYDDGKRVSFSSVHQPLRDFVADLAFFAGRKPSLRTRTADVRLTKSDGKCYEYQQHTVYVARWGTTDSVRHDYDTVLNVVETGMKEPVWDLSVAHDNHTFVIPGVVTGNCGEIILRPNGFCNLTEVVVRAGDTLDQLMDKVEVATIMGTFQSTLTNYRYIRSIWKKNAEEERLLGVSLTGIMDHEILNKANQTTADWLSLLRAHAVKVNAEWAEKLGIPASAAITTVKPSGTVSQLVDSASGIHPRYSNYYIRTVRADKKDPLAKFMRAAGFYVEDCVMKPDSTDIFSFPVQAPAHATFRNDLTAIQQLEHYLVVKNNWCEHNPSITVYVRDNEWLAVGDWVYNHFDDIGGVSFLPHTDHVYRQAPYTECTKETYEALAENMPNVSWDGLRDIEKEDATTGNKELACTAGVCELI